MPNFILNYKMNSSVKVMRVKNCMSELHAKVKLKEYLEKKHGKVDLIIYSVNPDTLGVFDNLMNIINGNK
jgi:hypothetical protein